MTARKPFTVKKMTKEEIPQINKTIDVLYTNKLESQWLRSSGSISSYVYQATEHGIVTFSATGSATVAQTFALKEKHNRIVHVHAHASSEVVTAHVTDITKTSISITCRTISGTAGFSAVTSASIPVYYQVIGSDA